MKQTSIDAHNSIIPYKPTIRERILAAMERIDKPLTSEQIALFSGLRYDQVWRRMSELERDNMVVCTDDIDLNSSGRRASKWKITNGNLSN